MNKVTIVGAMVAANGVTLFTSTGMPYQLSQSEWRTAEIMTKVAPALAQSGSIEIDLDEFTLAKKIETMIGNTNIDVTEKDDGSLVVSTPNVKIENGNAIRRQIEEIAWGGRSAKGFKNFVRLFEKGKVKHSMEELLTFMEKSDLPIADDGSIIAYKLLRVKNVGTDRKIWVDPHTKTVEQRMGSLVFMPASKVNDDRRIACSTGLHVCSARYLNYGGDVLTLVKVRPHDVIAVPQNDFKARVCAYQIVAELPVNVHQDVKNGTPLGEHPEGSKILADIIAGKHPPISSKIEVGANGFHKVHDIEVKESVIKRTEAKMKKPTKPISKTGGFQKMSANDVRSMVKAAQAKKPSSRTPAEKKLLEYEKKFQQAKKLIAKGWSLRDAASEAGIDRNKLSDNLKAGR